MTAIYTLNSCTEKTAVQNAQASSVFMRLPTCSNSTTALNLVAAAVVRGLD
jgi:hypothetical protein